MSIATAVTIDGEHLKEIRSALGAPLIQNLDWGGDTDDYIRTNILSRILRIYFNFFPIKFDTKHDINGQFNIAYPAGEPLITRKSKHFFNYKTDTLSNFDNPFFLQTQVVYRQSAPYLRPYHLGEIFSRLSTVESLIDYSQALRVEDYPNAREVRGSTAVRGTLSIQWLKRSNDFNDVQFTYLDEALKLSKAYLMQDAYRLRETAKVNNSKVEINSQPLKDDAEKWEAEVMASWKQRGFAVIVK